MANLITHSFTFSKESTTDYFLTPLFVGDDITDIVEVRTDIKSSEKLDVISSLSKITKAYAQGTSFTSSTGVTPAQKTITVSDMKAEVQQNGKAFANWVKQALLKAGVNENDISGTIFEEIILILFTKAIRRDWYRQMFFGDTNKETLSSGVITGTADVDYNVYNGFWTTLLADFAAVTIPAAQRITVANGAVAQVNTVTLTGTSGTANVTYGGVTYLATFATSLTVTATNFVTTHAAALAIRGVTITSSTADIIFTASIAGVAIATPSVANVSGNLAGTNAATTANTAPADLIADEAFGYLQSMIQAAPNELMELQDEAVILCTRSFWQNYKESLGDLANGTESAHSITINGVNVITYDGIPVIPRPEWDTIIATDRPGEYPHRALLTVKKNFIFGTDGEEDAMNLELFYDKPSQNNFFRAEYKAGTQYLHEELIVAAY